jgi:SdiA-regulated
MKTDLRAQRTLDVPLREVSGICLLRGQNHRMSLIAVGDRAAMVACLALPPGDAPLDWRMTNVAKFPGSKLPKKDPQIEAISADGSGRVLLLQESPSRVELLDLEESRVVASIELVVEGDDSLARSWSHPKGSRGEGVALLPDGHLLVAKEKEPAALIEFGLPGSQPRGLARGGALGEGDRWPVTEGCRQFVALATWLPDKVLAETCVDFSDLEIGPDSSLYLLSDQSATIARLDDLPAVGGTASLTAAWRLEDLKGKPEGLAFAPDGRAIVALDKRKPRRNLVLLEPAIASPSGGTVG